MCLHEKEYEEDTLLATFPAKRPWKCIKCGTKGYDTENSQISFEKITKEIEFALRD